LAAPGSALPDCRRDGCEHPKSRHDAKNARDHAAPGSSPCRP
jgi:hypothetical protein